MCVMMVSAALGVGNATDRATVWMEVTKNYVVCNNIPSAHDLMNNYMLWISNSLYTVCDSDEYECDNGECRYDPFNNIECDGLDHCDDGSDEHGCDTRTFLSIVVIIC